MKYKVNKAMVNPYVKIIPTKAEKEAGVWLSTQKDPVTGEMKSMPVLDKDTKKPIPIERSADGIPKPLVYDTRAMNKSDGRSKSLSTIELMAKSRGITEIAIPNDDPDNNMRKRTLSIKYSFIEDSKDPRFVEIDSTGHEDDLVRMSTPVNPYAVIGGSFIHLTPERRSYTDRTGRTGEKLMVPAGFDAKGQPVWDDGKSAVGKEGSRIVEKYRVEGRDVKTYTDLVMYDYKFDLKTLDSTLDHYFERVPDSMQGVKDLSSKYKSTVQEAKAMTDKTSGMSTSFGLG